MSKQLKFTENSEVLSLRISQKLKDKLENLAKRGKFGNNSSEVIRYLIEYHSRH